MNMEICVVVVSEHGVFIGGLGNLVTPRSIKKKKCFKCKVTTDCDTESYHLSPPAIAPGDLVR